jgi:anti-sigma B factor antagonist
MLGKSTFTCETKRHAGTTVVRLRGELDLTHAESALEVLTGALERGKDLVIDASELTFIDSAGIRSIVEAYSRAHVGVGAGRSVAIRSPCAQVRRVLELVGFGDLIEPDARSDDGSS